MERNVNTESVDCKLLFWKKVTFSDVLNQGPEELLMLSLEWNSYLPVFQVSEHYLDIHQLRKGESELNAPVKLNMWEAERPWNAFSTFTIQRSNGNISWSNTATWLEPCNRLLP